MNNKTVKVCVIGAGPAGLMAAVYAAQAGASVCVLERNSNSGRKLLVTGGGRCNLTHAGGVDDFVRACEPYGRFLKPAFYTLPPKELLDFFHQHGLKTVTEPDGCIFPATGRAEHVSRILREQAAAQGVYIHCNERVTHVQKTGDVFVVTTEQGVLKSHTLIIATGGVSWPQTGSTGDGYRMAEAFGHTIVKPVGVLCPVVCEQDWPGACQGVSLPAVRIRYKLDGKSRMVGGSMVFTADGIGGPAAFEVSRAAADIVRAGGRLPLKLDFCPDRSLEETDSELIALCAAHPHKNIAGLVAEFVPRRMAELFKELLGLPDTMQGANLSKAARRTLTGFLKEMPLTVLRCGPVEKATVTAGGVMREQIDFKTLQSQQCEGLFFAGEVIDVEGPCGGYNLQIAFSTGALAGTQAACNATEAP